MRLIAVIPASKLSKANQITREVYDPKNDTFRVGLYEKGKAEPKYYWCSALMTTDKFAELSLKLGKLSGVKLYDGVYTHPSSVLNELDVSITASSSEDIEVDSQEKETTS